MWKVIEISRQAFQASLAALKGLLKSYSVRLDPVVIAMAEYEMKDRSF